MNDELSFPAFLNPPFKLLGLRNAHVQTVLGAFRRGEQGLRQRPSETWDARDERLELDDGDFLDLVWLSDLSKQAAGECWQRILIVTHGLEGSSESAFVRALARVALQEGWSVVLWNLRGCGKSENRLPQSYHSGASHDLRAVVETCCQRHPSAILALVGISLGGNLTLKYLGEAPPPEAIQAAIAISAPVHLSSCAQKIDESWGNRLYLKHFLKGLKSKAFLKSQRFQNAFDVAAVMKAQSIREFDEFFTAPLHGFQSAEDYYEKCSALRLLPEIQVPTLLLNAKDDPMLSVRAFPQGPELGKVRALYPTWGGHVGFYNPFNHNKENAFETWIMQVLKRLLNAG